MNPLVEKLVMALEKDCEIYNEILRLGEEKKQVIIKGEIENLDKITKREHALIASIMKLEEIRDKIITELARESGVVGFKDIDEVIAVVGVEEQGQLQTVKRKLGNIMNDVKEVNASNGALIEQSLDIIDFNVNAMQSMDESETNYSGKAGIKYDKSGRNGFDVKV